MDNYYNLGNLLGRNKIMNVVIGQRGCGKTFQAKKWAIKKFIETGKEFIWVRRYKTELKELNTFFDDIISEGFFPSHSLEVKGKKAYIDGKVCGYFVALSVSANKKSVPYPNVDKIIFDEFMIEKGNIRYLPNEVETFLAFFDTVIRNRKDCRALLIGNNMSVVNPYFDYFKIVIPKGTTFWCNETIAIEYTMNEAFTNQRLETPFGQLIKGTNYGNFSLNNESLRDNESFVAERSTKAKFKYGLKYENEYYGIWIDYREGKVYLSDKLDMSGQIYAMTNSSHEPNLLMIREMKKLEQIKLIKSSWGLGCLYFESLSLKAKFFENIYPYL